MILTKEILERGKSSNGGWNRKQLNVFGIPDFKEKWKRKIIGKDFSESVIKEFLSFHDAHLKDKPSYLKSLRFEYCPKGLSYKEQYLHPNWQKMRLAILNRDKFTCINCRRKDTTLHVHHLKYSKSVFIWNVPDWYLVTLCETCHSKEHNRDLTIK